MCAEEGGNRDRTHGEKTGNVALRAQRQSISALPAESLHTEPIPAADTHGAWHP